MNTNSESKTLMEKFNFLLVAVLLANGVMVCLARTTTHDLITDQSALLTFKTQFTSDPYNILSHNWSNRDSVCNWIGISCGVHHQRVIALNLYNMGLSGTIAPHLGNLSFLSSLDISSNSFHGHVPEQLAYLHRLKYINLGNNNFSGEVPSWFGILPKLQYLLLYSNGFTGVIPHSLSNISDLVEIKIRRNNLFGQIPKEIANLSNVKTLAFEYNLFSGPIPFIFNMSSLETIDFSFNNLTGHIPADMCNHLPQLTGLYLSGNEFHGYLPSNWYRCRKLKILSLSLNQLTGGIPRGIGNLTMLTHLYIGANALKGEIPLELGNLKLEHLVIGSAGLIGVIPSFIFNSTSLKDIVLNENQLSGSLPWDICSHLPKLEKLYLDENKFTGDIPRSIGNCTTLTILSLPNLNLTGFIPQEIGKLLNLEELWLGDNSLSGVIPATIFNITKVRIISILSNQLSGTLPSNMGIWLPNLEEIYLAKNSLSGILPNSISNASRISRLELSYNIFSGIIPRSLSNLELLELLQLGGNNFTSDTSSTEELSFITYLANCKQLKVLSVSENPLNGILPISIGNLSSTSLLSIDAAKCGIKGNIPSEIGNLTNLVLLQLLQNDLDGYIPSTIKKLQHLQLLSLSENKIRGSIPSDLCNLRNMGFLDLGNNKFSNSMPTCLGNITSLRKLYLSSNKLSSDIPMSLWELKDLLELNLSSNSLTGYLPPKIGSLTSILSLDLSSNQLSGILPSTIGGLLGLETLFLSHNRFEGPIPESIGKSISLKALDLSNNNISGSIPNSLEELLYLQYLNVSFNKLIGKIPNGGRFINFTYESFMSNEHLCGSFRFHVPPCKVSSVQGSRKKRALLFVYILLVIVSIILGLGLAFVLSRRKMRQNVSTQDDFLIGVNHGRIAYHELRRATHEFSESNLLGMGSYGSVYSGILADGTNVAVKVFNLQLEGAFESFDTECEVLRNLRHRNLTKVISSCSNLDFKALVLEYMPNGSLEKWLYSHNYFLDILQRLNIIIDVACGLDYLHHGYTIPVVHCDLKPSNVLIDEHMVAHVTDFGIAKLLGEDSIVQTGTLATFGYIAPEFGLEGLVSTRCDVYSYGIMLMEIFTRLKPSDEKFEGDLSLKRWINDSLPHAIIQVIDANLLNQEDILLTTKVQCISSVMELALKCSTESPEDRMSMRDVVESLRKIRLKFIANCGRT